MCLLAGLDDNIVTTKKGKVKDRSWGGAKKQMLGNIKGFVETLKTFKDISDAGNVPDINWKEVRPYLLLEHFNYETIKGECSTCLVCKYKQVQTSTNKDQRCIVPVLYQGGTCVGVCTIINNMVSTWYIRLQKTFVSTSSVTSVTFVSSHSKQK